MPAIVGKADSYVELPWMAFAAGAAFAALAFVIADALRPHWTLSYTALLHATVILSAGGASVLLVIFAPPYARLLLRPSQVDIEIRQYVYLLGTYLIGSRKVPPAAHAVLRQGRGRLEEQGHGDNRRIHHDIRQLGGIRQQLVIERQLVLGWRRQFRRRRCVRRLVDLRGPIPRSKLRIRTKSRSRRNPWRRPSELPSS